ncbi:bifunctional protein GlmU [Striga asiatica]|uniref:Bifunctional protein GlmU n=1 Tax=Striga asiatica TaxID=4170 RepID=A0A5A7Q5E0_STRAF|nr:bifunctional protein GlmU [Striga asiatica]
MLLIDGDFQLLIDGELLLIDGGRLLRNDGERRGIFSRQTATDFQARDERFSTGIEFEIGEIFLHFKVGLNNLTTWGRVLIEPKKMVQGKSIILWIVLFKFYAAP